MTRYAIVYEPACPTGWRVIERKRTGTIDVCVYASKILYTYKEAHDTAYRLRTKAMGPMRLTTHAPVPQPTLGQ